MSARSTASSWAPRPTSRTNCRWWKECFASGISIRYLTERYFRYREGDASFGPKAVRRFSYAVLFKNIENHFKAPTYFIPVARFDEVVDFLQRKIEATILGKRNRSRGHRNYVTFDEFRLNQARD